MCFSQRPLGANGLVGGARCEHMDPAGALVRRRNEEVEQSVMGKHTKDKARWWARVLAWFEASPDRSGKGTILKDLPVRER